MMVFQTDSNGFFVGEVEADPDPREEGNWLIPGGAVVVPPPPLAGGERARWTGEGWEVVPPEPEPEPEPEPSPEELLEQKRAAMVCSPLQGSLAMGEAEWSRLETLLSDPSIPWAMRRAVSSATEWRRLSPTIDELAWLMGYSPEQVDHLFEVAMSIEV